MDINETIDRLADLASRLRSGNLTPCGEMLSLIESMDLPGTADCAARLKELVEGMILGELEGASPDPVDVRNAVEMLRDSVGGKEVSFPSSEAVANPAVTSPVFEGACEGMIISPEDAGLIRDFIVEAGDHLQEIEVRMVDWEKTPSDTEIINSIFRPFHTIKGIAGFLNLLEINRLSHLLENVLDESRAGRIMLSPELSDLIFDGVDALRRMVCSLERALRHNKPVVYDDIRLYCERVETFLSKHRGGSGEAKGKKTGESLRIGEILVKNGKIRSDTLTDVLERQADEYPAKPIGELLVEQGEVTVKDVRDAIRKQVETGSVPEETFIKVGTTKMDQLVDMVGELVIAQSMVTYNPNVAHITDPRFIRDIAQLRRVTASLQTISLSMRLVPIGATFQKMNRIVRDIARKTGKKISLVIEGHSAEIDRTMVDQIYDPLVHMVRNACDHGIGTPEQRRARGKPEEGVINIKAEHAGGKVVITISDDGNGLDRDRILAKALERGLVVPGERPDDRTIDNFIFMAGFSTAGKITEISGRGVGMDVVKKAVEKLRGTVSISSQTGAGTTFTIRLPLTTAIIDGLIVQVGAERFIIPTLSVRRLVRPDPEDLSTVTGKGELVRLKGRLIPIVRIGRLLGIEGRVSDPCDAVLVMVEEGGREAALLADDLLGKQEVVIKNLGKRFEDLDGVSGGAILGDGRVGLILDIGGLLDSAVKGTVTSSDPRETSRVTAGAPHVE